MGLRPPAGRLGAETGLRRWLRHRWLRVVPLVVLLLAAVPLVRNLPTERQVRLRIHDPATLTRVELTWIAPAATTALLHSAWTFAPGRAPPELRTVPRLAAGSYRLHVRAQRGQTAREIERTIPFDSDAETVIVVP